MGHKITLVNNGQVFDVEDGETILDAALRHEIPVRYGCRQGKCSTCKHLIVDGDYDDSQASDYALNREERDLGMSLLCRAYPLSDCSVQLSDEAPVDEGIRAPIPQEAIGRLVEARRVTPTLWSVKAECDEALRFLAGQYAEIGTSRTAGVTRTYSIASPSFDGRRLEFLVQQYAGGAFSGILDTFRPGDELHIAGPYGQMYLRSTERAVVLIGEGVGVSPLLSIVRTARRKGWGLGIRLIHGATAAEELAYHEELSGLSARKDLFAYRPYAEPLTRVLNQEIQSGLDADVYVSGAAQFCEHVTFLLEARGVDSSRIFVERFYAAT